MARRSGLGKGLGALIPNEAAAEDTSVLREIMISQIVANQYQPRQHFDEESLAGLTASVRELGVLQPVLVRPAGEQRYELIAGERRWRAAKRAGPQTIPCVVRETDNNASLEQALVENLHREDLNPIEEAAAYQQLLEDFGLSHDDLSRRVGKSRSTISNTLRLFKLPPSIQRMVAEARLSAGHARALLGTPDRAYQEALARRIVDEQLSVRDVEDAVRARGGEPADGADDAPVPDGSARPASTGGGRLRPPGLLELEELLSDRLSTRVKVTMGASRGRVVIDFSSLEDLERIYRAMTEEPSTPG